MQAGRVAGCGASAASGDDTRCHNNPKGLWSVPICDETLQSSFGAEDAAWGCCLGYTRVYRVKEGQGRLNLTMHHCDLLSP